MGVTPAMNAVKNKNLEMLKVLADAKANVNALSQTNAKTTCAIMAAEQNSVDILQFLKDNGADLTKKNPDGLMQADILISKHDVVFDGPRGSVTIAADASATVEEEVEEEPEPEPEPEPAPAPAPAPAAQKAFDEPAELHESDSSDFAEARKMQKKKKKRKKRKKKKKKKKKRKQA